MYTPAHQRLTESQIVEAFHIILRTGLQDARSSRLIDDETLRSLSNDTQIAGSSLCLFLAALKADPYSGTIIVPSQDGSSLELSPNTCPDVFTNFFDVWRRCVPIIQSLDVEAQQELARLLCDLDPALTPIDMQVIRVAAQLRSLALEISQRSSFKSRFYSDVENALNSKSGHTSQSAAAFKPPPAYDDFSSAPPVSPPPPVPPRPQRDHYHSSPPPSIEVSPPSRSGTVTSKPPDSKELAAIRETLYSCMLDVFTDPLDNERLLALLHSDPPRGYFASIALALYTFSLIPNVLTEDMRLRVVSLDSPSLIIGIADCPSVYRKFFKGLTEVIGLVIRFREADVKDALERAQRSEEDLQYNHSTRLDRLKERLFGAHLAEPNSPGGQIDQVSNAISRLALGLCNVPSFVERQDEVFKVIAGFER